MFRLIELVSYGSIADECVFVMSKVSLAVNDLDTLFVMALVSAVMRAARIVSSMTVAEIASS